MKICINHPIESEKGALLIENFKMSRENKSTASRWGVGRANPNTDIRVANQGRHKKNAGNWTRLGVRKCSKSQITTLENGNVF